MRRLGAALCIWLIGAPLALAGEPASDRFDTVVIDPGHGGDDHGAEGPDGLLEKSLVLDVAQRVRTRLRAAGLHVLLTRDDDVYVPLERRTAIANEAQADLFLSIHANASSAHSARGVETFFLSLAASDDVARQVAARENAAFRDAAQPAANDDPLVSILGDMAAADQLRESDEFARLAMQEVSGVYAVPSRGVKQAPFVVLMGLAMPASLVEIGFVSNRQEAQSLADDAQRDRIADALARAVLEFGRRYDARRGIQPAPSPTSTGGG
ncbi:MAG TPA: N-acetylmuramoyl-L-alanine amidase [Myxococcota bacterium]|nr:N-acetylmuramoyl-L-alanine amidase [Myxococcota bacterium]